MKHIMEFWRISTSLFNFFSRNSTVNRQWELKSNIPEGVSPMSVWFEFHYCRVVLLNNTKNHMIETEGGVSSGNMRGSTIKISWGFYNQNFLRFLQSFIDWTFLGSFSWLQVVSLERWKNRYKLTGNEDNWKIPE